MKARDTSIDAMAAQVAAYRAMGPARRVELAVAMSEEAREISRAGIRARHPEYSQTEVECALRRLVLGDDLYRAAWPGDPVLKP